MAKVYEVQIRDENLTSGRKAGEGEAKFVLGNQAGCIATLPDGTQVKFIPTPRQPGPSLMADRYHPGKPHWTAFNHENRGRTVVLTVE